MRPPGLSCFTSGGGTWLAARGDDDAVVRRELVQPEVAVADVRDLRPCVAQLRERAARLAPSGSTISMVYTSAPISARIAA